MRVAALVLTLPLLAQDPGAALERARQTNRERATALPNFVVDEIATRYKSDHTNPPKWTLFDTIQSEVSVKGAWFGRQNVYRDGKPWKKPDLSDFAWGMPFGNELVPLFDAKCTAAFDFEGPEEGLLAFRFHSPAGGCFGSFAITSLFGTKYANPARLGRVLIEPESGDIIQSVIEAIDYPKDFPADPWKQSTTWDYVKIGDATHLLPIRAEIQGGFKKADLWRVVVAYRNHRHFQASTRIDFEDPR